MRGPWCGQSHKSKEMSGRRVGIGPKPEDLRGLSGAVIHRVRRQLGTWDPAHREATPTDGTLKAVVWPAPGSCMMRRLGGDQS